MFRVFSLQRVYQCCVFCIGFHGFEDFFLCDLPRWHWGFAALGLYAVWVSLWVRLCVYVCVCVCVCVCRVSGSNPRSVGYCRVETPVPNTARPVSSPAWHRNCRRRRSLARLRIKAARSRGLHPPLRELHLLAKHHSRPLFKELGVLRPLVRHQMGGKRGWGRGRPQQPQHGSSWQSDSAWDSKQKWQIWHGAWSPRNRSWEQRYDQTDVSGAPALEDGQGAPRGGSGLLQAMQKTFNTVKKHDTRLRKIQEEKELRKRQFAKFQEDTKNRFARQQKLYEQDMVRLDSEYQTAMEAGHMAAAQMKALIVGGTPPAQNETMNTEAAWQALWQNTRAEPPNSDFLREAYAAVARSHLAGMDMAAFAANASSAPSNPGGGDLGHLGVGAPSADGTVWTSTSPEAHPGAPGPVPVNPIEAVFAAPAYRDEVEVTRMETESQHSVEEISQQEMARQFGFGAPPPGLLAPGEHPAGNLYGGYAIRDPYIMSPGPGRAPGLTSPAPKRTPIKQQRPAVMPNPNGPPLGEKLDQRRAIHPFGILPGGVPSGAINLDDSNSSTSHEHPGDAAANNMSGGLPAGPAAAPGNPGAA